jgi:hypothetical protein
MDHLGGQRFNTNEEVMETAQSGGAVSQKELFAAGISKLPDK